MDKKTLYISDLDGTLLTSGAELSDFSRRTLGEFTAKGFRFGIATARSPATAAKIMKDVPLSVPAILMNGVCLYDIGSQRYEHIEYIAPEQCRRLIEIIHGERLSGFMFTVENGLQHTYYENTDSPNALAFIEERRKKYGKSFARAESFVQCEKRGVIYYSVSDRRERLACAYEKISALGGLRAEFYRDVYDKDFWYLEVCSASASKYRAAMLLRERFGFERMVSFGDNFNDLPLFEAADICYAPENAADEIKRRANGVIPSNDCDGVAKKLIEVMENEQRSDSRRMD